MRFRLSMTLNCYKLELSRNFAIFPKFGSQQQLNEWRQTCIVRDRIVAHLNVLFSGMQAQIALISHSVTPLRASNKVGVGKTYFRAKCVNISKTVGDIRTELLIMNDRKLHMRFLLTLRSVTLDDLVLLYKLEFQVNSARFRSFGGNKPTRIVSDSVRTY